MGVVGGVSTDRISREKGVHSGGRMTGSPILRGPQESGDTGTADLRAAKGGEEKPPPAQNLEELEERHRGRLGLSVTCP